MSTHCEFVPDSVADASFGVGAGAVAIAEAQIEDLRTSVHQVAGGNQTWSWKRPKWHGTRAKVHTYSKRATIDEIFGSVKKDAECIFEHFDRTCFGAYRRVAKGGSLCSQAFHLVMSMEITLSNALDDEMWFRIGDVNIRFSKVEFALVTGLRFGDASFNPTANHTPPSSGIHRRLFNGRDMMVKDIFMEFTEGSFEGCSPLDRVKVVKILFLYFQLVGADNRRKVDTWVWTLVEDDAAWDAFPWGFYSYQLLLLHLKGVRVDEEHRYHVFGNISAFLCWAYEAIPPLAAVCAERVLLPSNQIPRALRWKFLCFYDLEFESLKFDEFPCVPMLEITPEEEKCYQDWWPAVHLQNMSATSLLRKGKRTGVKKKKKAEKESRDETRVGMSTRKKVSKKKKAANKPGDPTRVDMSTRKRVSKKKKAVQVFEISPRQNSEEEICQGILGNEAKLPDNPATLNDPLSGLEGDAGCDFVDSPIANSFQTFPRRDHSDEAPSTSRQEVSMRSFEILCNSERQIEAAERTRQAFSLDKHGLEKLNPIKIERGINRTLEEKVLSLEKEIHALKSESEHREEKLRECHVEAERGLKELRVRVSDLEIERRFSGSIVEELRRQKLEADVMLKESERRSSEKILGLEKEIDLMKRRKCLENKIINKLKIEPPESVIREGNLREKHAKAERSLEELQFLVSSLDGEKRAAGWIIEELRREKLEADEIVKQSRRKSLKAHEAVKVNIRNLLKKNVDDLVDMMNILVGDEDATNEQGMTGRNEVGPSAIGNNDIAETEDYDEEFVTCPDNNNVINSNRGQKRKRSGIFGADMMRAFQEDDELCIQAVCEFYRQASDSECSNRGFYHFKKLWQRELEDYLIQGDPEVLRPIAEVKRRFPHVVDICRQLAIEYSSYFIAMPGTPSGQDSDEPHTLSVSLVCRRCYMLTYTHDVGACETGEEHGFDAPLCI